MIFAERSQVDAHSLASSAGGFLGGYAVFYVLRVVLVYLNQHNMQGFAQITPPDVTLAKFTR